MHVFTDRHGKRWAVELTLGSAKKVRALTGVDIYKLAEDRFRPLSELLGDLIRLVDVVYCLSSPLDNQPASDEDFGGALSGDSIDAMAEAFCLEIQSFFPTPAQRQAMATVLKAMRRVKEKLTSRAEKEQQTFDLEKATDEIVEQLLSGGNGSSSSASNAPAGSSSTTPSDAPSTS